ncbi:MAG: CsbD family protein [Thermoleophilaceae bacterium]
MGLMDKISGRAKKAAGDLTGDPSMRKEGTREEKKGEAKEQATEAQQRAEEKSREAEEMDRRS